MFGFQNRELAHGSAKTPNEIHRSNVTPKAQLCKKNPRECTGEPLGRFPLCHTIRSSSCIVLNRNGVTVSYDLGAAAASIVFSDFNQLAKVFLMVEISEVQELHYGNQQTQKNSKTCMSGMSVNSSFKISYIYRSDNNQQTTSIRSSVDFSVGKYPKFSERSGSHGSPTFRKKKVMDQNGLLSELGHIR